LCRQRLKFKHITTSGRDLPANASFIAKSHRFIADSIGLKFDRDSTRLEAVTSGHKKSSFPFALLLVLVVPS